MKLVLVVASVGILMHLHDWRESFAANRGFVQLSSCLVPTSWVSDLSRRKFSDLKGPRPSAECLDKVQRIADPPRRLSARLELVRGDLEASFNRWPGAIAHYQAAKKRVGAPSPGIDLAIVNVLMWNQKDYPSALSAALDGLKQTPGDHDLRVNAAVLYLFYVPPYSDYSRALSVMKPELGLSHPYYYNIAAGSYLGLGESEKGLPLALEGVRLARLSNDPSLATSLFLSGLMRRCLGRVDEGIADLRAAQALAPADRRITAAMGELAGQCGTPVPER